MFDDCMPPYYEILCEKCRLLKGFKNASKRDEFAFSHARVCHGRVRLINNYFTVDDVVLER